MNTSTNSLVRPVATHTRVKDGDRVTVLWFWNGADPQSLAMIPHVNRLLDLYVGCGLKIRAIHEPVFPFEATNDYLSQVSHRHGVQVPTCNDLDHSLARHYGVQVIPNLIVVDRSGAIDFEWAEHEDVSELEHQIRQSLALTRVQSLPPVTESGQHRHRNDRLCFPASSPLQARLEASPELVLTGSWQAVQGGLRTVDGLSQPSALELVFAGFGVWGVLGSSAALTKSIAVTLNGRALDQLTAGRDVSASQGQSTVTVDRPRLYELVRSQIYWAPATLALSVPGAVDIFSFSFVGCRQSPAFIDEPLPIP